MASISTSGMDSPYTGMPIPASHRKTSMHKQLGNGQVVLREEIPDSKIQELIAEVGRMHKEVPGYDEAISDVLEVLEALAVKKPGKYHSYIDEGFQNMCKHITDVLTNMPDRDRERYLRSIQAAKPELEIQVRRELNPFLQPSTAIRIGFRDKHTGMAYNTIATARDI
jgi:hypothetical protein